MVNLPAVGYVIKSHNVPSKAGVSGNNQLVAVTTLLGVGHCTYPASYWHACSFCQFCLMNVTECSFRYWNLQFSSRTSSHDMYTEQVRYRCNPYHIAIIFVHWVCVVLCSPFSVFPISLQWVIIIFNFVSVCIFQWWKCRRCVFRHCKENLSKYSRWKVSTWSLAMTYAFRERWK